MHYMTSGRVETARGPAFVNPELVVAVLKSEAGAILHMDTGHQITCSEASETIAKRLWRFQNVADNAYWNEKHLRSIEPSPNGGCELHFTGGVVLPSPMPSEAMNDFVRRINETRNANVTQP